MSPPYAQPAPLDLTSKSGFHLYTDAQEALKVPFNRKAANVQPFLNSLAVEVKKFSLDSAVEVTNAAGHRVNLLTNHGSFSETDAEAFFNTARHEQITGIASGGGDATLAGADAAAQLLQAKKIQCSKILFVTTMHWHSLCARLPYARHISRARFAKDTVTI